MTPRVRRLAAGFLATGGVVAGALSFELAQQGTTPSAQMLREEAGGRISDPKVVARLVARHDTAVARFGSDEALRESIAQTLVAQAANQEEITAWYSAHRELFGNRSLERSRPVIEQLVRIEKTRKSLGIEPIEVGRPGASE